MRKQFCSIAHIRTSNGFAEMYVIIKKKKNRIAFHEEKIILPDDNGFIPSSSSTNDTLSFDLPLFSFSCENFDKVCFAPTE